jgi:hypothetical protein
VLTDIDFFISSIKTQFAIVFPQATLESLDVKRDTHQDLVVTIAFTSAYKEELVQKNLEQRHIIMEKYFQQHILLKTEVAYVSQWDFN